MKVIPIHLFSEYISPAPSFEKCRPDVVVASANGEKERNNWSRSEFLTKFCEVKHNQTNSWAENSGQLDEHPLLTCDQQCMQQYDNILQRRLESSLI